MFKFQEGQTLVLKEDMPLLGLKAGEPCVVWALYATDPPAYEITIRLPNGKELGLMLDEDELQLPPQSS